MPLSARSRTQFLICQVGSSSCALRLDRVVETMRPLPIDPLAGAPDFVSGVSVVRGEAVPIVDAARLIGAEPRPPTRLVCLRVGSRRIALAVDAVQGIQELPDDTFGDLPPLLEHAPGDAIAALGTLDSELLLELRAARLVPESVWALVDSRSPTR